MADQHEMDKLNDDIRRLTQENKTAFATRMKLEADKNKLENLLTNNLVRRRDELVQVSHWFIWWVVGVKDSDYERLLCG